MWTSTELAFEHRQYDGRVWWVVEAQHRISTNRLVANGAEQELLEILAEEVKPRLPESAGHLDFLLSAPFRYGHRQESRFRMADELPGIFYAAESEATAIAEAAYWRLRFFSRSPSFTPPSTTIEHTSFHVRVSSSHALDLTAEPFIANEQNWTSPVDYAACQELASAAREANTGLIRTISARDPQRRCNVVILDPAVFAERSPRVRHTWHFRYQAGQLIALAAFPSHDRFEFTPGSFGLG